MILPDYQICSKSYLCIKHPITPVFMPKLFIILILCLISEYLYSQVSAGETMKRKTAVAVRTQQSPRVNGILDDAAWNDAPAISGFSQYAPVYGGQASFSTEVKILYDDYALYIGAKMFDPYPDSILMQLGNRDDDDLNADMFGVEFDTYNNQLDGYSFRVTSSGVQLDFRERDETYNGVWLSAVRLNPDGWTAEMMIPYSAMRFPKIENQRWGFQLIRSIRRHREIDQFSLEKPGAENDQVYWGELLGISDVKPPVRLSVIPYLSAGIEHYPQTGNKPVSTTFGGGTDLKYGVNESYTLDVTLLPDFSQVQSDNKIKNLSAFETVYTEQRPFFREAVDLFSKGDIFYSRRIGKTPTDFYTAADMAGEGWQLKRNPVQQRLLNATKFSGRGKHGLAVGLLNAVTGNTYAIAENTTTGEEKRILTDPATNHNVVVFDQALRNNSDVYVINTSVLRSKDLSDANVTAAGIQLNDRKNTYQFNLNGGVSQLFDKTDSSQKVTITRGYKYYTGISKVNGRFQWMLLHGKMDKNFDANDLGTTLYNNYTINMGALNYNLYAPWWKVRESFNKLQVENTNNAVTGHMQSTILSLKSFTTLINYLTLWVGFEYSLPNGHDYYEARLPDRFYIRPSKWIESLGFSSDYRKPVALDGKISLASAKRDNTFGYYFNLKPIFRLNNHLLFDYSFTIENSKNEIGYAGTIDQAEIIFGLRDISTIENKLTGRYMFRNNMSINLAARHYWSQGDYNKYYTLETDGLLSRNEEYNQNHDFTFNAFNIDLSFLWLFRPGCRVSIMWKNAILSDTNLISNDYFRNFVNIFDYAQQNNLTFKVIYYIDIQNLKRIARKEKNHY